MIEEPPLLTINSAVQRPRKDQIEALKGVPTGFLVDAMNGRGGLSGNIQALSPNILGNQLCGPALTCLCGPADLLAIWGGLDEVESGDVMVASTGNWQKSAVIGDRVMGMLKNAGGSGFLTDGMVRDIEGIEAVGLPVFCRGISPNSPFSNGPGEIGFTITIGDVSITAGDLIVSDANGAVVVPLNLIDEVIAAVEKIRQLEITLDAEVAAGLVIPDWVRELLSSERVKRL